MNYRDEKLRFINACKLTSVQVVYRRFTGEVQDVYRDFVCYNRFIKLLQVQVAASLIFTFTRSLQAFPFHKNVVQVQGNYRWFFASALFTILILAVIFLQVE